MKKLLLGLIIAASVFTIVSCTKKENVETPTTTTTEIMNPFVCRLTQYDSMAYIDNSLITHWHVDYTISYLTVKATNRDNAYKLCAMNNVRQFVIPGGRDYDYGLRSIWCGIK
jgi:uncharacterized lipoprotein YehR (DUF1307 family)